MNTSPGDLLAALLEADSYKVGHIKAALAMDLSVSEVSEVIDAVEVTLNKQSGEAGTEGSLAEYIGLTLGALAIAARKKRMGL